MLQLQYHNKFVNFTNTNERWEVTMMQNLVSLGTVYIRQDLIVRMSNAYCVICDTFDGFEYIKDG